MSAPMHRHTLRATRAALAPWPPPSYPPSAPYAPTPTAAPPVQPVGAPQGVHWGVWGIGGLLSVARLESMVALLLAALVGGLLSARGKSSRPP